MKTEQEIRNAFHRFDALADSARRTKDRDSYECTSNIAMALAWVVGIEPGLSGIDKFLEDTMTINREDN